MRGRSMVIGVLMLVASVVVAVPASAGSDDAAAPETVWICHPDVADNPCLTDLTATIVRADGTTEVEQAEPASNPKIDCFYVYPTVSAQQTTVADLSIGPETAAVAQLHASRFSQTCRVFAPVYRQVTIAGLSRIIGGETLSGEDRLHAYNDVLNAWKEYLDTENDGRGVVLIGHSQGTFVLTRLIQEEIDDRSSLRKRLVSALLIGQGSVTVAKGKDVGGAFEHVPACGKPKETGCVVAYSSFLETPPPDSLFGRVGGSAVPSGDDPADLEVLCTNPANLAGGSDDLVPYFRTDPFPGIFGVLGGASPSADTPWVQYPDLYTASCEHVDETSWLQVDVTDTPGDTRPRVRPVLGPTWGLHLVDVQLALGNLVKLVRTQARAYTSR